MSRRLFSILTIVSTATVVTAQPSSERFIVFGLLDGHAVAFDYAAGGQGLVQRVVLDESAWTPDHLLRRGPPEFVRLQVSDPNERPRYRVKLFRIDYGAWRVTTLLESRQIVGLGAGRTHVYLRTDRGPRWLDRRTGAVTKPTTPFEKLHDVGRHWIVRVDDAAVGHVTLFDPEVGRLGREFTLPAAFDSRRDPLVTAPIFRLSEDARLLACVPPVPVRDAQFADSAVWLLDLETGKRREYAFRAPLVRGSGIPGFLVRFDVWFTDTGELNYFTTRGDDELRRITVSTATWERSERLSSEDALNARHAKKPTFYAPSRLEEPTLKSRTDLLALFLEHHAVAQRLRRRTERGGFLYDGSAPVGFSVDGKRFLGCLPVANDRRFFYGDLERDTLREIPTPEGFRAQHVFCWEP